MSTVPGLITRTFSARDASAEEWLAFHAYLRARAAEDNPGDPIVPDEVRQRDMQVEWPLNEVHRIQAVLDEQIKGSLVIWTRRPGAIDYDAHARLVTADAGVLKSERRRGIGSALLRELQTFMQERGRTTATLSAHVDDGIAFLRAIGAVEKHRMIENRLDTMKLDQSKLQGWQSGIASISGLTWEIHAGRVPLDRYAELAPQLTTLLNSQPLGTLDIPPLRFDLDQIRTWYADMDAHGGEHVMVLLRDGDMIAAVSEAVWNSNVPDRAYQNLTAVALQWRGKGLAKAVKARLLQQLLEIRPEVRQIITTNANVNSPMLAVNARLGFVRHRQHCTFQIDVPAIAAAVARHAARHGD